MKYLQRNYPDAVKAAMRAYKCFEPYGRDVQEYAKATLFVPESCEHKVMDMLIELRQEAKTADENRKKDDGEETEAYFNAEQNAVVAKNAELYYRTMIRGGAASWNVRDHHMMDTLTRLRRFHDKNAKSIVWAHNTHIGDARATDMQRARMVNLGQLVREEAGRNDVVLAGFGTFKGTTIAAREWEEQMEKMSVPPAVAGSWDRFLHEHNDVAKSKLLTFVDANRTKDGDAYLNTKSQRAIGVVYNPGYEAYGNYVDTILAKRYDAFLFIDETRALHPLHMPVSPDEELPETFPTGV